MRGTPQDSAPRRRLTAVERRQYVPLVCAFCGRPGSSREHVFAKWLVDALGGPGEHGFDLLNADGVQTKRNTRYIALYSRAACVACNTGWMSRSENAAKPLLAPVIQDRAVAWRGESQRTVAAWAFKTALTWDRARRPEKRVVPDADFRALHGDGEPPHRVTIHLARYDNTDASTRTFAAWGRSSWATMTKPDGTGHTGYRITFLVGAVIFQTFGTVTDERVADYLPSVLADDRPLPDVWRQLWPQTTDTFAWPPRGAHIATTGLDIIEPP